ncbi:ribonuclease CAF1 [Cunninghamella echinulata]|nr:ribonuclease CAF1 [Cunninghamella echinulata]
MEKNSWRIKKKQQISYTEVDNDNFSSLYDSILDVISQAHYIAIDTEFSGHKKDINKNMEDRYKDLSDIIRSHSLLSFGLTVITDSSIPATATTTSTTKDGKDPSKATLYQFSNFEFLTLNQQSFKIDPTNIKFLVENGFDFSRIFQIGIPFTSGNNSPYSSSTSTSYHKKHNNNNNSDSNNELLRQLWHSILRVIHEKSIPIIVHNGLLDIMYLYDSFITSLPSKLSTFVADLVEMFPSGIYDTKYISTSLVGESKSYLAYLYCKYSRLQEEQKESSHYSWSIQMLPNLKTNQNKTSESTTIKTVANKFNSIHDDKSDNDNDREMSPAKKRRLRSKKFKDKKNTSGICGQYSQHGWCTKGGECTLSHDMDVILDFDLGIKKSGNIELNHHNNTNNEKEEEQSLIIKNGSVNDNKNSEESNMSLSSSISEPRRDHASHFDAFMTAFVFCYYKSTLSKETLSDSINKLNLMRLNIPLRIAESHYSKPSEEWSYIKSKIWPNPDKSSASNAV